MQYSYFFTLFDNQVLCGLYLYVFLTESHLIPQHCKHTQHCGSHPNESKGEKFRYKKEAKKMLISLFPMRKFYSLDISLVIKFTLYVGKSQHSVQQGVKSCFPLHCRLLFILKVHYYYHILMWWVYCFQVMFALNSLIKHWLLLSIAIISLQS